MSKLFEMLQDRNGKYSLAKVGFCLGAILFLSGWTVAAFNSKTVPEMPQSLSVFLGVLSLNSLGKSYLANQENKTPPPVN